MTATLTPLPPAQLATASTADLRAELARLLGLSADTLGRMAAVWGELTRRGEDLSDLKAGLYRWVRLIAAGQLDPLAVVAFARQPATLERLAGLPLERQRALAGGEAVAVIAPADPELVERLPLSALPAARAALVLADGAVLSPAEQRVRLAGRKPRKGPADGRRFRPRLEAGGLRVGKMLVPLGDVLKVLAAEAGPDRPPPTDVPEAVLWAKCPLHHEEHAALLTHAKRAGLPAGEMVRKALRAFGLTTPPDSPQ